MEALDYWRLCDELNIIQAALLIVGEDPGVNEAYAENWEPQNKPPGYEAAKTAISGGLRRKEIEGVLMPIYRQGWHDSWEEVEGSIDLEKSMLKVPSLRNWLAKRGLKTGFFFPEVTDAPEYLDASHARYAPKLAAAVQV